VRFDIKTTNPTHDTGAPAKGALETKRRDA
jgi:hypothetical protein